MNELIKDPNGDKDLFKILMLIAQGVIIPASTAALVALWQMNDRLVRVETKIELRSEDQTQVIVDAVQTKEIGSNAAEIKALAERLRILENGR